MNALSREWLMKMADAEDKSKSISVGGLAIECGMIGNDECPHCGIGTYLPSGRCDHCNLHRTERALPKST